MAVTSELLETLCSHCEREIPTPNFNLHYLHCSRNLQKCTICGEMVPKRQANDHFNEAHAPVDCSLCSETVEREAWSRHKDDKCPKRIVICEYCEFPLPAVDLFEHQETCGNRTEMCHRCNKYIRLREKNNHEIQFHMGSDETAESSRDAPMRRENARRRQARNASQKRLLFTIAISGIAVLVGSFFLQK